MTFPFSVPDRVILHLYAHRDDPPETRASPVILRMIGRSRRESMTRVLEEVDTSLYTRGTVHVATRQQRNRSCYYYDLTPQGMALARRLAHLAELGGMTPEQVVSTRFRDRNNIIIPGGERVACTTSQ